MANPDIKEKYKEVLNILISYKSMPFLELTSVSNIDEKDLKDIINDLEKDEFVKVIDRDNILEEIVTVREKGFAVK